jgi:hypothetical protein
MFLSFCPSASPKVRCAGRWFPSIEDWTHTFTSILLGGLDLQREPLDVSIPDFKPDGASAANMASLLI